ncbi:sigma-70 family RNA polymerase sigma factor [bacterium]|nr:sigma-70 family RNA polymerase sigma factor [bacterium]
MVTENFNQNNFSLYEKLSDEEVIKKFQEGDEDAFLVLVKRYEEALLNFVCNFTQDKTEAQDVVQETFLKFYKNKSAYRKIAKFNTWLFTIARNIAKTEITKKSKRKLLSITQLGYEKKGFEIPDKTKSKQRKIETDFAENLLNEAIKQLPVLLKEVIILYDFQGLSYEEISLLLVAPLGTIKSRLSRGRRKLQEKFVYLNKNKKIKKGEIFE